MHLVCGFGSYDMGSIKMGRYGIFCGMNLSLRDHYLVLHVDKRSESMIQTQLEEVRFWIR